ncbi:MAG TPA: site-specific integrase [Thermoplasmata archaeon]
MGRYPLKTAIGRYMNATSDYYSPTTLTVHKAVLYAIEREYATLREETPELKADPKDWGESEIIAVMTSMRARQLTHATQAQQLSVLKKLLEHEGNSILTRMKSKTPRIFPKVDTERKGSLTDDELAKVLSATEQKDGWPGECARFVFAMYAYTGIRLSELLRASRTDIDTDAWTFKVSHPKGERTFGRQRVVPIPDPLKPIVKRFLRARETRLAQMGMLETTPLVFPRNNPQKHVDSGTVDSWKAEIVARSGVRFSAHGLRRTYGQMLLDRNVSIETVSVMLGHNSTQTTERHYCRKTADSARLEVIRAMQSPMPTVNSPKLTPRPDLAGYA